MSDKPDKPKELMFLAVLLVAAVGVLWVFSGFVFSVVAEFEAAQWLAAVSTLAIAVLTFILAFETLKMRKNQDKQIEVMKEQIKESIEYQSKQMSIISKRDRYDNYYKFKDRFLDLFNGGGFFDEGVPQCIRSPDEIFNIFFDLGGDLGFVSLSLPEEVFLLCDEVKNCRYIVDDPEPIPHSDKLTGLLAKDEAFDKDLNLRVSEIRSVSRALFSVYCLVFTDSDKVANKYFKEIFIGDCEIDKRVGGYSDAACGLKEISSRLSKLFLWLESFVSSDFFIKNECGEQVDIVRFVSSLDFFVPKSLVDVGSFFGIKYRDCFFYSDYALIYGSFEGWPSEVKKCFDEYVAERESGGHQCKEKGGDDTCYCKKTKVENFFPGCYFECVFSENYNEIKRKQPAEIYLINHIKLNR